jgi:hypothetical protein
VLENGNILFSHAEVVLVDGILYWNLGDHIPLVNVISGDSVGGEELFAFICNLSTDADHISVKEIFDMSGSHVAFEAVVPLMDSL